MTAGGAMRRWRPRPVWPVLAGELPGFATGLALGHLGLGIALGVAGGLALGAARPSRRTHG